jgi:hypothetical protein
MLSQVARESVLTEHQTRHRTQEPESMARAKKKNGNQPAAKNGNGANLADLQDAAIQNVLQQAEALSAEWTTSGEAM